MPTKYPIILVHGMAVRDDWFLPYWGRIPHALREMGCQVFFSGQDSLAPIEVNARMLRTRIRQVMEQTGAKKVNLIAHSKGGLDSRYAISRLGMGRYVASLTTLSTPHHGSPTMDQLLRLPAPLIRLGSRCADWFYTLLGDRHADTYTVLNSVTTASASEFNRRTPNCPHVYYQSYAFVMRSPASDVTFALPNAVVSHFEGENDGLLAPRSVKWGDFRGTVRVSGHGGISHRHEVDLFRLPMWIGTGKPGVRDILQVYRHIVRRLEARGY